MALKLVSGPDDEPITLDEAKLHCKVDVDDDDDLIEGLITAVRQAAEQELGRSLGESTWRLTLDAFPDAIRLDNPPVVSVTSVKYIDEDGVQQTMDAADYRLDAESEPGWIVPAYGESWPSIRPVINAVEVIYVAGYDSADVPQAVKQWMLAMIGAAYDHRDAVQEGAELRTLPFLAGLLDRYRVMRA